ncbi:MAG: hypothetical protein GY815_18015, partial [Gammaproteobacteria bacterium]|nr:hypothetical protein [Gammaproteobacteria bacterium]
MTDGADVFVETLYTNGPAEAEPMGGNITLADELDLNGAVSGTATLTLRAHHAINIDSRIGDSIGNDDRINLSLQADINDLGGGDVNIAGKIDTEGGTFSASGDNIALSSLSAVLTQGGALTLTANASGAISIEGTMHAGSGTIDATGGDFQAGSSRITAGAVDLDGISGEIVLGKVTADSLSAKNTTSSATSTTQTFAVGGLVISGNTTLRSSGDITLNDGDNDFGTVSGTVSVLDATTLTLVDTNSIILGPTSTDILNVTAGGDITQSGAITATTLRATGNDITLSHADNDFSSVAVITVDDLNINDTNDLTVGVVDSFGNVTLSADQDLTLAGAITVSNNNSGSNTRNIVVNFGQDNAAPASFSLNETGSIATTTGSNDSVNIAISGGANSNTFTFDAAASMMTESGSITVAGG